MTPDFRVPGSVKLDNGPQDEENFENAMEENATEDTKKGEETTDTGGARAEGRAGNSDVPTERTGPVQKDSSEETPNYRHVPGGAWLNKPRAFLAFGLISPSAASRYGVILVMAMGRV
ncbi:hypothetical protein NDU88_003335 [Pleurodeles waltl]|uniref:Uncharacterized protein n=1 Tax=Pleurodeles waltl TaxID=8319 RepID=A0AAV7SF42_PLEWA|nr:hypothetical protein NDU88_003335 [Pleurodeles waltl]